MAASLLHKNRLKCRHRSRCRRGRPSHLDPLAAAIAACSVREQEAGTSRSSRALTIRVGHAMADARRKIGLFQRLQPQSRFSLP